VDTYGAPTSKREISPIPGKSDRRPTPKAYAGAAAFRFPHQDLSHDPPGGFYRTPVMRVCSSTQRPTASIGSSSSGSPNSSGGGR